MDDKIYALPEGHGSIAQYRFDARAFWTGVEDGKTQKPEMTTGTYERWDDFQDEMGRPMFRWTGWHGPKPQEEVA